MLARLILVVLLAPAALAFETRVVLSDGRPLRDAQVSIVGRSGSFRSDAEGRVMISGAPELPFRVIVIGPRGEIYEPIEVTSATSELRLQAAMTESITVTSGVAPNIDAPPAAATAVVGREEIEQRTPEHLVDALERTAGITRRGEGPSAVPVVRGLAGGRTLLLVDDARITAERRAGPSATFLDPFTLGSIELARGPGSVAYGSDAFGGVIHARPRDPAVGDEAVRYHASLNAGASDFRTAGAEVTRDLWGGAMLAALYGRAANDSEAGGGVAIPNSSYRDRGLSLRFARPGERQSWRAGLAISRATDVEAPSADALVNRTFYPTEESARLTFAWDAAPAANGFAWDVRGAAGKYDITTSRERLPSPGVTRQISSSEVAANDASLRVIASRAFGRAQWQAGTDLTSRFDLSARGTTERFDAAGAPIGTDREIAIDDARRNDAGFFVTLERPLTRQWLASAGVRTDLLDVRNRGGFFGSQERNDAAWSGHVALTGGPWAGVTATLQAASGYREPTLSDRYFRGVSGRGFVVGNPELEPERSVQFDGSLRWSQRRTSVALFAYHYTIRDLIERYRSGADFRFRNRGEALVRGLELELFAALPAGFALQGNAALARGEAVDDRQPLDDIAAPNAHLALRWSHERLSAFAHAFWFGRDERPGPVEVTRPGYATFDTGIGWRWSERLDVRLQARNLFDRRYAGSADANAALAPGRTFGLAIAGRL